MKHLHIFIYIGALLAVLSLASCSGCSDTKAEEKPKMESVILSRIRQKADLVTTEVRVRKLAIYDSSKHEKFELKDPRTWKYGERKCIVPVDVTIKYGYDLRDLTIDDVKLTDDSTAVVILLPEPKVIDSGYEAKVEEGQVVRMSSGMRDRISHEEVDQLMDILNELRSRGVSCIYISHKLDEVYRICDRVMVLRDGQSIRVHDIQEVDEQTLIEEMVGRKIENLYPKVSVPIGDVVMKVEHLSVPHPTIKNRNIVEDISFSVRKGEILGIGGLVGAGRSEILGAIFGQITKGVTKTVEIEGKSVQISGPPDAIDHGIGFVTEERKLNGFVWMLSIRDNMYLPSLKEIPTKGGIMIDAKEENKRTTYMFDRLKIKAPSIHTIVNTLSGGNQQKVVLSKWLLKSPKILFVDEPTKGVDVGAKAEIYSLMGELVKSGISIVMVSSDMPELLAMSDRVLVISSGHITGEFDREHLSEEAVMRAAIK